jgi:hypothetical protein
VPSGSTRWPVGVSQMPSSLHAINARRLGSSSTSSCQRSSEISAAFLLATHQRHARSCPSEQSIAAWRRTAPSVRPTPPWCWHLLQAVGDDELLGGTGVLAAVVERLRRQIRTRLCLSLNPGFFNQSRSHRADCRCVCGPS